MEVNEMKSKTLNHHVLIIDHAYTDKQVIQKEQQSYNLIVLSDFQNALNLISANFTPKVIVCNIDLEGNASNGLTFISTIKVHKSWSSIPVIALSKHSHSDIILESLKCGAIDFVKCPYEPSELFSRIEQACRINQSQDIKQCMPIEKNNSQLKKLRKLYVETMKYAVLYWETSTKLTKIDLAESSEIWSVYLDKNGVFRTRTLDRYLKEESLPKNPKVQQILLTANYVLNHCKKECIIQNKLKRCFYKLLEIEEMSDNPLFLKN
jgi:two-component system sensor histidine kinase ChiS